MTNPYRERVQTSVWMSAAFLLVAQGVWAADPSVHRTLSDTYLLSDGSQAIDTEYCPGPDSRIVVDMEFVVEKDATYYAYGVDSSSGLRDFWYAQSYKFLRHYAGSWVGFGIADQDPRSGRLTVDYDVASSKLTVTRNGISMGESGISGKGATSSASALLFSRRTASGGVDSSGAPMKLYSCQIYEKGTLVRDFIPYGYGAVTGLYERCRGKIHQDIANSPRGFKIGTDAAYLKGDYGNARSVAFDTGLRMGVKSKISLDFALTGSIRQGRRVIGAEDANGTAIALYVDGSKTKGNPDEFYWSFGTGVSKAVATGVKADGRRYEFTADQQTGSVSLTCNGQSVYSGTIGNGLTSSMTTPVAVFARASEGASGAVVYDQPCEVKVYGFKVWDDVLPSRTVGRGS